MVRRDAIQDLSRVGLGGSLAALFQWVKVPYR
jgi:hypothetical protein